MSISHRSVKWAVTAIAVVAAMMLASAAAQAGTILYVDDDAPSGGDGLSWDTAYRFLQDALADASGGGITEIRVAQGAYLPDRHEANPGGTGNREATFQLINAVSLRGGYAGFGAPDPDARDIKLYETILTGDLLGNDGPDFANNDENSYHVTTGSFTDDSAVLDGFTITAGNADGTGNQRYGGGMYNNKGSPTLNACRFSDNAALWHGGGMYNGNSNSTLNNCIFSGNLAARGGGIYDDNNSNPTLNNCVFSANSASKGGGMYNIADSSPMLTNCAFSGNSADSSGGAIYNTSAAAAMVKCTFSSNTAVVGAAVYNSSSNAVLTNCVFTGNSALAAAAFYNLSGSTGTLTDCTFSSNVATTGSGGGMINRSNSTAVLANCAFSDNSAATDGGAISNYNNSSVTLVDCILTGNTAERYGGGLFNDDGGDATLTGCTLKNNAADLAGGVFNREANLMITNCTLLANTATLWGGAMYNVFSDLTLTNCTLSGNFADSDGGGLYNVQCSPVLANCTFSHNSAGEDGGGIFNQLNANPALTNCILWLNTDGGPTDESAQIFHLAASQSVVNYSCVYGWTGDLGGIGNIDDDPFFVDADGSDNIPGTEDDNLRLQGGSPCIDAGDNTVVPQDITTDLEGNPRFVDDPCTEDTGFGDPPIVDMGPYEFQGSSGPVGDLNGDCTIGIGDLLALLGAWGPCESCPADLDGDGSVGILDLLILLSNWSA